MKRIKVAIVFASMTNFDRFAFKYFILYVNKIQKTYEFFFPDLYDFPIKNEGVINYKESIIIINEFIDQQNLTAQHFIAIITNRFDNNYFFSNYEGKSVITTDVWNKYFSPPSLFEYLLHCIYTCLIYSKKVPTSSELTEQQKSIKIHSHKETRGCIADFARQKHDDRVDIMTGYICEEHSKQIQELFGQVYLDELQHIIDRKWIGKIEEKGSVAYNLKHIFKFNIDKDSGFEKNLWDKIKDGFYSLPSNLTGETIKIVITATLTYYLIKLGIIDKK